LEEIPPFGGILNIPATRGKRSWGMLELENDEPVGLGVPGLIDHAHSTLAQFFLDVVMADRCADHGLPAMVVSRKVRKESNERKEKWKQTYVSAVRSFQ